MEYIKPTEGAYLKHKNGNILLYGKKDAICTISPDYSKYRKEDGGGEHGNYDKDEAYVPATPNEILWINKCMELGRYIPFKDTNIQPEYEIY